MSVSGSKSVILGLVPLIAFRRYRGTDRVVVAFYVIISTGIAVDGDMLPCDTADLTGGNIWVSTLRAYIQALR